MGSVVAAISPTWVLTAAHCCQGFTKFTVRAGDLSRKSVDEGEQEVESTRLIIHDGWNLGGWLVDLAYDICLVELESPLVESEVVGFAELPAISDTACQATYSDTHYWEWLKPDMICAGDLVTPSMGPCNGDSGGGLMDGNQIVGITSWEARGCGHPEHPD